ncbi:hypothetical protein N2152v2_008521 [Parachlorella kessleri]
MLVVHPKSLPTYQLEEALRLAESYTGSPCQHVVVGHSQGFSTIPATYFGKGLVHSIHHQTISHQAKRVYVNAALTGVQQRNLEAAWGLPVLDRVGLIIEIFGQRARTKKARLQVELASLEYKASRLVRVVDPRTGKRRGFGLNAETEVVSARERGRSGSGSGGLGAGMGGGESEIELQRRRVADRRRRLLRWLEEVRRTRAVQRAARRRSGKAVVAVVGYTNAGKSSLVNALSKADVGVEDRLFATLDPTLRRVLLPSGKEAILSDTVGFISDLPHQLMDAFRATLEEVCEADLLLHVLDASSPQVAQQREAVLRELNIDGDRLEHSVIEVWNKMDLLVDSSASDYNHGSSYSGDSSSSSCGKQDAATSKSSSGTSSSAVTREPVPSQVADPSRTQAKAVAAEGACASSDDAAAAAEATQHHQEQPPAGSSDSSSEAGADSRSGSALPHLGFIRQLLDAHAAAEAQARAGGKRSSRTGRKLRQPAKPELDAYEAAELMREVVLQASGASWGRLSSSGRGSGDMGGLPAAVMTSVTKGAGLPQLLLEMEHKLAADTDTPGSHSHAAKYGSLPVRSSTQKALQVPAAAASWGAASAEGGDVSWGSSRPLKRTKRSKSDIEQHPSWSDNLLARKMPTPKRKADDSSSEDDIAQFAAVAVTSETLQKQAAKSAEANKKKHARAVQRQRGGGGVLGAATGSDAENGDEPLVLDSVQLKVAEALQQRLSRALEEGSLQGPGQQQQHGALLGGPLEEAEDGSSTQGVRLFKRVPRGAPLLLQGGSRPAAAASGSAAARAWRKKAKGGARKEAASYGKGASRGARSSDSNVGSEASSSSGEDEAHQRCLAVAVEPATLQRAAAAAALKAKAHIVAVDGSDEEGRAKGTSGGAVTAQRGEPGALPAVEPAGASIDAAVAAGNGVEAGARTKGETDGAEGGMSNPEEGKRKKKKKKGNLLGAKAAAQPTSAANHPAASSHVVDKPNVKMVKRRKDSLVGGGGSR